jgi:hypothetical protein
MIVMGLWKCSWSVAMEMSGTVTDDGHIGLVGRGDHGVLYYTHVLFEAHSR